MWIIAAAGGACAAGPAPDAAVVGKRWVARAAQVEDARQAPRLEFAADGRLTGYTGCNALSGKWRVENNELRLGALVATKRGCIGAAGEVERRVLAVLGERSRVLVEGGRLVIQGENGERIEFVENPSTP